MHLECILYLRDSFMENCRQASSSFALIQSMLLSADTHRYIYIYSEMQMATIKNGEMCHL